MISMQRAGQSTDNAIDSTPVLPISSHQVSKISQASFPLKS